MLLPLDSVQLFTQGDPLSVGALVSQLHPDYGTFTGVGCSPSLKNPLFGQIHYTDGDRSARLSFLLPVSSAEQPEMVFLIEALAVQAGGWGAFNLLAEADEGSPAFSALRKAGFSTYARQRIWRLSFNGTRETKSTVQWQPACSTDEISVGNLAHSLVPPLVQSSERFPSHRSLGLVYYQGGELMAYVESIFGPRGIFLFPLVHPEIEDVVALLQGLESHLFPVLMRPVYLSVRSYQAWIETALEKLEWQVAPQQALMVKHLTRAQQVYATNSRLSTAEQRQVEPTIPIIKNFIHPEN